ncbi:phage tail tube protein FII [Rhodobiaceae bacterium]|nr:phage tail tube protein FII [Rhodobiaceae bacterium]
MSAEGLKRFDMFIEGGSFLSVIDEVTLPKLSHVFADYRAGGMPGPAKMELGWEEMMLGIKFLSYPTHIMNQLAKVGVDGTGLRFVGAYGSTRPGVGPVGLEIVARGQPGSLDFGTAKLGELTEFETEWPLTYFKLSRNNEPVIELDFINGIEKIGSTDLAADIRQILGLT